MGDHVLREALLPLELLGEDIQAVAGRTQPLHLRLGLAQPHLKLHAVPLELPELLLDALHLLHLLLGLGEGGVVAAPQLLDIPLELLLLLRGQHLGLLVQQGLGRLGGQEQLLLLGQDLLMTSLEANVRAGIMSRHGVKRSSS